VDLRLDREDRREGVHGHILEREAVGGMLDRLAAVPLEERRQVQGLDPARAPTIVAGAAILAEAIDAFCLGRVETSERDILHGAALAASTTDNG
jgi:exopolyphosphatase/guanosine-5'-triphosphate,3'-diphosphate pyrophosphatase